MTQQPIYCPECGEPMELTHETAYHKGAAYRREFWKCCNRHEETDFGQVIQNANRANEAYYERRESGGLCLIIAVCAIFWTSVFAMILI